MSAVSKYLLFVGDWPGGGDPSSKPSEKEQESFGIDSQLREPA
jgi:hypothetical protein